MRYRKLSPTGDYTFGSGGNDFHTEIQAVAQAVQTRLQLYKESFWRDLNAGIPMFQRILGTPGSPANIVAIDNIIQQQIKGTQGVTSIVGFDSSFNAQTRQYQFTATIQTEYSTTVISGVL